MEAEHAVGEAAMIEDILHPDIPVPIVEVWADEGLPDVPMIPFEAS